MPRKIRELRADLRRSGFVLKRIKGSHQTWEYPNGSTVTVSGNDGNDAKPYQEQQVRDAIQKSLPLGASHDSYDSSLFNGH